MYQDDTEHEERQNYYVYSCPVWCTVRESMDLARSLWGKPEAKRLIMLEAKLKWHSSNPKGSLKEVSEIALEIHDLESIMFDMVWAKTNTQIPDGI